MAKHLLFSIGPTCHNNDNDNNHNHNNHNDKYRYMSSYRGKDLPRKEGEVKAETAESRDNKAITLMVTDRIG
jgi:hypothetical protein